MVGHGEQGDRAVGIAAIADGGHVPISHNRHCGQRLAGGMWMRHTVTLSGRGGQLGAQSQVLLHWLTLALVEMELGIL